MSTKIWIGLSTVSSPKEAELIAKNLINLKLAACVNIVPKMKSFFCWEGKLCVEEEVLLIIKTTGQRIKKTIKEIKRLHSYQIPEIIFWEIREREESYGQWVRDAIGSAQKSC